MLAGGGRENQRTLLTAAKAGTGVLEGGAWGERKHKKDAQITARQKEQVLPGQIRNEIDKYGKRTTPYNRGEKSRIPKALEKSTPPHPRKEYPACWCHLLRHDGHT